jgi:hypothetical protein
MVLMVAQTPSENKSSATKFEIQNLIFTKILPVGAEMIHANRRTDMTKLIGAFREYAKVPRNDNLNIIINFLYNNFHCHFTAIHSFLQICLNCGNVGINTIIVF